MNPKAGSAAKWAAVQAALGRFPQVRVVETTSNDHLVAEVKAAAARNNTIILAGGDGTVHAAVNALAPDFPAVPVLILPLGTGNDLCRTLGLPEDPVDALNLLETPRVRKVDAVAVSGDWTGTIVNTITGGFSGKVAQETTGEVKQAWGPFAYLRGAAGPIMDPPVYKLTLSFDGAPPMTVDALNIVVANGRFAAGGITVAPKANLEDGKVEVVVVRAGADAVDRAVIAARLLAGDYHKDETVFRRKCKVLTLRSDPPLPVSFDGEAGEVTDLKLDVRHDALRLITGPGYKKRSGLTLRSRLFHGIAGALMLVRGVSRMRFGPALMCAAGFLVVAAAVELGAPAAFDKDVLDLLARNRSPELTRLAVALTDVGTGYGVAGIAAAAAVVLTYYRRRREAVMMAAVLLTGWAMITGLKLAFGRVRPDMADSPYPAEWFSFPSGHAVMAAELYGLLATFARRRWATVACILFAAGICWCRMYLGVHYPSDVVAGVLAGLACLFAGRAAFGPAR